MILADTLKLLTTQTPTGLTQILKHSGYKGCFFKQAEFVGITNGGEFAYKVTYADDTTTSGEAVGKVFVKYNTVDHSITADF
jgi:hypothetical protein